MHRRIQLSALAIVLTTASLGYPQAVRTEKNMSLELANRIATAAVAAGQANGYAVTVTVVDRVGGVRAVQRADNAGPHTVVQASRRLTPRLR